MGGQERDWEFKCECKVSKVTFERMYMEHITWKLVEGKSEKIKSLKKKKTVKWQERREQPRYLKKQ